MTPIELDKVYKIVSRLEREQKVLIDLLRMALGVIDTLVGENDDECQMLSDLQNKIAAALMVYDQS